MLGHGDRDRRQLLDLVAHRIADGDQLVLRELVAAVAAIRPMINDLVDRPRRQQRPPLALMPRLAALTATRGILAAPRRRTRMIDTRRLRAIARAPVQPPLKQRDPLILTRNPRRQDLNLRPQPLVLRRQRQQNLDDRLPAPLEDRLRVGALHTPYFAAPELCPPTPLNAYFYVSVQCPGVR